MNSLRIALIVDDNDDYTTMLLSHLKPAGYAFERARSASEGLKRLQEVGPAYYTLILTDITMEGQTAGLSLIRRIRKTGYRGVLMVASTGFNSRLVLNLSKPFLVLWGVDILIPKEPLKSGKLNCVAISSLGRSFMSN